MEDFESFYERAHSYALSKVDRQQARNNPSERTYILCMHAAFNKFLIQNKLGKTPDGSYHGYTQRWITIPSMNRVKKEISYGRYFIYYLIRCNLSKDRFQVIKYRKGKPILGRVTPGEFETETPDWTKS